MTNPDHLVSIEYSANTQHGMNEYMLANVEPSHELRQYLVSELRNASKHMVYQNIDSEAAMYWYSAAFGAVQRVTNITSSPKLVLLHTVLQWSHSQITGRLGRQLEDRDRPIAVPPGIFAYLGNILEDLADSIEGYRDYTSALESIAIAGYITTGNGYYLYEDGRLQLL